MPVRTPPAVDDDGLPAIITEAIIDEVNIYFFPALPKEERSCFIYPAYKMIILLSCTQ